MIRSALFLSPLRAFLSGETAGGIALFGAAMLAMILANTTAGPGVAHLLHAPVAGTSVNAHLVINDGLMAIFFLLVGLEIKREMVEGALSHWTQRTLPVLSAAAGMAVPAAVYLFVVHGHPGLARGWAIPAATDIAFAMAVLMVLGNRVPVALKLFLVTVAIVDDLGAVAIIALFYSGALTLWALGLAILVCGGMYALGRMGVDRLWPYFLGFALLWGAVLTSGVHATVAGVLAALFVPAGGGHSPLHRMETLLARPVGLVIVPLFGFANAGVRIDGIGELFLPLPLAVAAGLVLGKQAGIFGAVWLAERCGIARRPDGVSWMQVYGVALLCGIGFTMSLFIGGLAFADPALVEQAKLGTLAGSCVAALAGYAVLWRAGDARRDNRTDVTGPT